MDVSQNLKTRRDNNLCPSRTKTIPTPQPQQAQQEELKKNPLKKNPNNPLFKENLNNIPLKNNPNNSPSNKKVIHKPLKSAILTLHVHPSPHSLYFLYFHQNCYVTRRHEHGHNQGTEPHESHLRTLKVGPEPNQSHQLKIKTNSNPSSGPAFYGPGVNLRFSAPEDTKATART